MPPAEGIATTQRCQQCGHGFTPVPAWRVRRFCTHACYVASLRKPLHKLTCEGCKHPFSHRVKSTRFCSQECVYRGRFQAWRHRPPTTERGTPCKQPVDILEQAPDNQAGVSAYFRRLTPEQLDRVWVALVVEQFGGIGSKGSLSSALQVVRARMRRRGVDSSDRMQGAV